MTGPESPKYFVRNTGSKAPPQTDWNRISEHGASESVFQQALQVIFMCIKAWESQFLILLWAIVLMWAQQAQKIYLMFGVNSEMLTHGNKSYKVLTTKKWHFIDL